MRRFFSAYFFYVVVVTMLFDDILPIAQYYDAFLIDMFGVLFNGDDFFDTVLDKLACLRRAGKILIIVSNTTQTSSKCEENYDRIGLRKHIHYDYFVTSGSVMREMFGDKKVFQIFKPNNEIFNVCQCDKKDAEYAYIGIPKINGLDVDISSLFDKDGKKIQADQLHDVDWQDVFLSDGQTTLGEFDKVIEDLNLPFLCANPDFFAFSLDASGNLIPVLRQGAIAMRCQKLGKKVIYTGKPYGNIYEHVVKICPLLHGRRKLAIGDTPWTDISGANDFGIDSVLTFTGCYSYFLKMYNLQHSDEKFELFINEFGQKFNISGASLKPRYIAKRF